MTVKPLIARASFARTELSESQIARVSGGDDATEVSAACEHGTFTVDPTWENNRGDTKGHCGD